ncbi:MAG: DUF1684 domain-containing protein [Candidatus Kapabacteria bacterium]|nr:DUF1684 domain-containing protein [Candidatus Kapabacteria bacterium]
MILRTLIIGLMAVALLVSCEEEDSMSLDGFDEQEILDARKAKDELFKGDDSPIKSHLRDAFTGLLYFEPDADYAVDAVFVPASRVDTFTMQTTSSELRQTLRVGSFSFEIQNKKMSLFAYQFSDGNRDSYFVPFTDRTNGEGTYKAGRYLDVKVMDNDSSYVLDFNMAYNPYCAYDDNYSCPIVPRENDLSVAIKAGEKK